MKMATLVPHVMDSTVQLCKHHSITIMCTLSFYYNSSFPIITVSSRFLTYLANRISSNYIVNCSLFNIVRFKILFLLVLILIFLFFYYSGFHSSGDTIVHENVQREALNGVYDIDTVKVVTPAVLVSLLFRSLTTFFS